MGKLQPFEADHVQRRSMSRKFKLTLATILGSIVLYSLPYWSLSQSTSLRVPKHAEETKARCRALNTKPGPPADFGKRTASDRFQPGTKAVWIKNATLWTGDRDGTEVIEGDLLLENGLIKAVGKVDPELLAEFAGDRIEVNAEVSCSCAESIEPHC
jgi:hypothetical protein